MKIFKATRKYESWLREEWDVFEDDMEFKAQQIAEDPFKFFRGTFYRWIQLFPDVCRKVARAPVVLAVGDLHVSNFGTWRDAKGDLIWGINDLDEAAYLPYTQDLVRLAASVELASAREELKIDLAEACEAIVDGYRESLEKGGEPFIIDGQREWLKKAYGRSEDSAKKFWEKLNQLRVLETEAPREVRSMLEAALPLQGLGHRIIHRQAGVGSLGRPRFTALAEWQGGFVAREVKALLTSAAAWAQKKHKGAKIHYKQVLARAVRRPDPIVKVHGGWVLRGLAPDHCRIDLTELGAERDETRMMYAMGWETANIHLGTRRVVKSILADLKDRKPNWLRKSAQKMVDVTWKDWEMWKDRNAD